MPRRLLRDARRALEEDVAPTTSDYWTREHTRHVEEAEARARQRAIAFLEEREREVREVRATVLRELTEVRDQLHDLASEGSLGRLSPVMYSERLDALRARQRKAEQRLAKAEESVERISALEADPIAWADDLASRFPHLKEDFPW